MHSSEFGCIVGFDPDREVAVCLTRRGVWELDAAGRGRRSPTRASTPPPWHNDAGATWDPVEQARRRCSGCRARPNSYAHILLTWTGKKLDKLPTAGLPELCSGMFDPCAMFVGHPEHGVVCYVGGDAGMYALAGAKWKRLPDAEAPPPKMAGRFGNLRPRLAYHPSTGFAIGPGPVRG